MELARFLLRVLLIVSHCVSRQSFMSVRFSLGVRVVLYACAFIQRSTSKEGRDTEKSGATQLLSKGCLCLVCLVKN